MTPSALPRTTGLAMRLLADRIPLTLLMDLAFPTQPPDATPDLTERMRPSPATHERHS